MCTDNHCDCICNCRAKRIQAIINAQKEGKRIWHTKCNYSSIHSYKFFELTLTEDMFTKCPLNTFFIEGIDIPPQPSDETIEKEGRKHGYIFTIRGCEIVHDGKNGWFYGLNDWGMLEKSTIVGTAYFKGYRWVYDAVPLPVEELYEPFTLETLPENINVWQKSTEITSRQLIIMATLTHIWLGGSEFGMSYKNLMKAYFLDKDCKIPAGVRKK